MDREAWRAVIHGVAKSRTWLSDWTELNWTEPVFPASLVKEIVFSLLYILASFVKDKVSIGAWIYLWAFYFVPLIYISVFVPVPYCLDDCGFVVEPEDSLFKTRFFSDTPSVTASTLDLNFAPEK